MLFGINRGRLASEGCVAAPALSGGPGSQRRRAIEFPTEQGWARKSFFSARSANFAEKKCAPGSYGMSGSSCLTPSFNNAVALLLELRRRGRDLDLFHAGPAQMSYSGVQAVH